MGRKKKPPDVVERRRYSRKATKAATYTPAPKELNIAKRMYRRFYHNDKPINTILMDYRYWQARRCGWDVMRTEINMGEQPQDCYIWLWWTSVHRDERDLIVALSRWIRTGVRR